MMKCFSVFSNMEEDRQYNLRLLYIYEYNIAQNKSFVQKEIGVKYKYKHI